MPACGALPGYTVEEEIGNEMLEEQPWRIGRGTPGVLELAGTHCRRAELPPHPGDKRAAVGQPLVCMTCLAEKTAAHVFGMAEPFPLDMPREWAIPRHRSAWKADEVRLKVSRTHQECGSSH